MKITQTDTEVTIVFDKNSDEYKYGFLPLIDIADITNAEMINFAGEFKHLLKKADPKEQMAERWDDLFIKITGACMDALVQDGVFAGLIASFYNQIGEAMGPVSYAGFEVRQYFKNNKEHFPSYTTYQDWVDECLHVYSESDFVK